MVKFKETLLAHVLVVPRDIWRDNCLYIFVLNIPLILVAYTFGVAAALFIDYLVFVFGDNNGN